MLAALLNAKDEEEEGNQSHSNRMRSVCGFVNKSECLGLDFEHKNIVFQFLLIFCFPKPYC